MKKNTKSIWFSVIVMAIVAVAVFWLVGSGMKYSTKRVEASMSEVIKSSVIRK